MGHGPTPQLGKYLHAEGAVKVLAVQLRIETTQYQLAYYEHCPNNQVNYKQPRTLNTVRINR